MKVAVLVPTYRRPLALGHCLRALEAQKRGADCVFIVCRSDDGDTAALLSEFEFRLPISVIYVVQSGQVAALNAGLAAIEADVVAITDDDAAPRPEWLLRIERHFLSRPEIGGVGGRDYLHGVRESADKETQRVGIVQWHGRQIGNQHVGIGPARYVQILKGANMSFRTLAIGDCRFDTTLRGSGAQVHNDLSFCFAIQKKGWRLLYDPEVAVDHYPAVRFDEDQRSVKSKLAMRNMAFNETVTLLKHLSPLRGKVYVCWALVMGARDAPGFLQCIRLSLLGDHTWSLLPSAFLGRFEGIRTAFSVLPRRMSTVKNTH